jgi:tRNA-Thr(GGU) m(6)t(6)A37 methyltransferase TsaA
MEIIPIAVIRTEFPEKFGVPRQSGLASALRGRIVFNKEFRDPSSLRGLEDFSHLWLIWEFSCNRHSEWHPTVRPPRLGGNASMGVFATRSPFRPTPLGLSCVEIEDIEWDTSEGPVINVKGADLVDGTPIYDIKPYIRYADSRPDARCGYVDSLSDERLSINVPSSLAEKWSDRIDIPALIQVLELDPRPSYQNDPDRVYGMKFMDYDVRFTVDGNVLTVIDLVSL